jgi:YegS/Rv2252/BmrU family lipid kinase
MVMAGPYARIHVVVNPASGKNQPILNTLNDVFSRYGVDWSISVTKKYGDATEQAKAALDQGVDLVAGYGGDGTQHEIANAVLGSGRPMGILPGGTGNGFANEMGIPKSLRAAVEVLCTSTRVSNVDAAQVGSSYFIQRMYAGIEPDQQTTRAQKDRYGVLAYAVTGARRLRTTQDARFRLTIDGRSVEATGVKCYVVNSGMTGKGVAISQTFSITDGLLDVFVLARNPISLMAAEQRLLQLDSPLAGFHCWQGRTIRVDAQPPKTLWTDGEHFGQTPVTVQVLPGALAVVVP